MEALRQVKTVTELERVAAACAVADHALERLLPSIRAGVTPLAWYRRRSTQIAGVFVAAAAGNEGPGNTLNQLTSLTDAVHDALPDTVGFRITLPGLLEFAGPRHRKRRSDPHAESVRKCRRGRDDRRRVRAVGLGRHPLRLGRARRHRQ